MAMNAMIPMQVQQMEIDSPINSFAKMQQLKTAQQQNALADMAMQEKQRAIEQDAALSNAYGKALSPDGKFDRQKLYTGVAAAGLGKHIPDMQTKFATQDKSELEAHKLKLESMSKFLDYGERILRNVNDQASYDAARERMAQINPDAVANMSPIYDPNDIMKRREEALSLNEQLTQQSKAVDAKLAQDKLDYAKKNDAANRGVTMRGQNLVDARAKTANELKREELNAKGTNATEDERKAAGWLAQATYAYNNMAEVLKTKQDAASPSAPEAFADSLGLSGTANALRSPDRQKFVQAGKSLAEAALRAATGAGVNVYEAEQKIEELTPQWTDSDELKGQKLGGMKVYIDSLKVRAGRAVQPGAIPPLKEMQFSATANKEIDYGSMND